MPSIINATTSTGLVTTADNSGSLQLATNNGTTALAITTSQNVGIGTTTPAYQLDVRSADPRIALSNDLYGVWFMSAGWTGADDYSIVEEGVAERLRITNAGNLMFNSGYGSVATAFGCRAWCNLNGTSTVIRGSGNISSVTKVTTGIFQYNFTNAMPDTNYTATYSDDGWGIGYTDTFNTGSFRSATLSQNVATLTDYPRVLVAVFR
jgi:hypothetical protein